MSGSLVPKWDAYWKGLQAKGEFLPMKPNGDVNMAKVSRDCGIERSQLYHSTTIGPKVEEARQLSIAAFEQSKGANPPEAAGGCEETETIAEAPAAEPGERSTAPEPPAGDRSEGNASARLKWLEEKRSLERQLHNERQKNHELNAALASALRENRQFRDELGDGRCYRRWWKRGREGGDQP